MAKPVKRKMTFFIGTVSRALQLLLGLFCRLCRTLERDDLAFLQAAGNDDLFIVALADLDVARDEVLPDLNVDRGLAVLVEARSRRDQQLVRLPLDDDLR